MTREHLVRRLTAIFAADVAGYSRLTGMDEEGTHVRLKEHLRVLIDPKVAAYRGHIVKNTGDGFLAEFNSVVDAMRCAVDVQRGMVERNLGVPPSNRVEFRIGINVGDIIEDNGDIFGDGVNVAARLEAIAEPGAFVFPMMRTDNYEISSILCLTMPESKSSRTLNDRSAFSKQGTARPQAIDPHGAPGQTLDCRATFPEPQCRPGPGVFRRWRRGRHHDGAVTLSLAVCNRT